MCWTWCKKKDKKRVLTAPMSAKQHLGCVLKMLLAWVNHLNIYYLLIRKHGKIERQKK